MKIFSYILFFTKLASKFSMLTSSLQHKTLQLFIAISVAILTSGVSQFKYEQAIPRIIEKTELYEKVVIITGDPNINYGWKFSKPETIYRLKYFD